MLYRHPNAACRNVKFRQVMLYLQLAIGLLHKAPLKDGDRFPVTLTFRRAGEREVMVWVQTPRDALIQEVHTH